MEGLHEEPRGMPYDNYRERFLFTVDPDFFVPLTLT